MTHHFDDNQPAVRAVVLTGFGINCDFESQFVLNLAGARADRVHINQLAAQAESGAPLDPYHIMVVPGGFSWADDHGAGVLLGMKLKTHLGGHIDRFIGDGKLIVGICNGFQALVNMGLLPGFDGDYRARKVALTANDCGNFRDDWVHLTVNPDSPSVFTSGVRRLELPVRHGEGKFYAPPDVIDRLESSGQVVLRYARPEPQGRRPVAGPGRTPPSFQPADGVFPYNPNGSINDIAGICDPTGRVFGLMPHPEAFWRLTNHPDWTAEVDYKKRWGFDPPPADGAGLKIFQNAVEHVRRRLID
jgi:phosphoribosylformylglycinamidine synthase